MARPPLYSPLSLAGEVVLVTGATSGIGEACAYRFAEAGCKLILLGRRKERLEALKQTLEEEYRVSVHLQVLDVQQIDAIEGLPEALPESHRHVSVLVNNAGLALGVEGADSHDMKDVVTMITTNVTALIAFSRAFLPGFRARGKGHLINVGSIAGHEAYAGGSAYCATKHAVDAFTTAARHDLVGTPIRVTVISPGMVNTEFSTVRFNSKDKADSVYENIEPLVAADIADNILYAATRPAHVQIADIVVLATNQSAAKAVARVGPSLGGPQA